MLPQSSLIVIPGVGHIAFEEEPEICNQAMRDWLGAHSAAQPESDLRSDRTVPVARADRVLHQA